jgi:hypothetical protein
MPALVGNHSGWACLRDCAHAFDTIHDPLLALYYFAFVFTNGLFVIVAIRLVVSERRSVALRWVAGVLLMHVLSWCIWNLVDIGDFPLLYGYFVWLSAYAVLFAATFLLSESDA